MPQKGNLRLKWCPKSSKKWPNWLIFMKNSQKSIFSPWFCLFAPKGWKLPEEDGSQSYGGLLENSYIIPSIGYGYDFSKSYNRSVGWPLNFTKTGQYYDGSLEDNTTDGSWWTSTFYMTDSPHVYGLYISNRNGVHYYMYDLYPGDGHAIRCLVSKGWGGWNR